MFEFIEKIKFLGQVLRDHKKAAFIVCIIILLAAVVESFGLSMILPIMQVLVEGNLQSNLSVILNPITSFFPQSYMLSVLCLLFLLLILLKSFFTLTRIYITKKFVWQLRLDWLKIIFKKYLESEYAFIHDRKQGDLLNNLTNETQRAAVCIAQLAEYAAKLVLLIVLYMTLLAIHWQITLVLSLAVGILLLLTNRIAKNFAHRIGRKKLILNQELTSRAAESLSGIRQIKVFGLENWFYDKFIATGRELSKIEVNLGMASAAPSPMGEVLLSSILVGWIFYMNFYTEIAMQSLLPTLGVFVVIGQRLVVNISLLAGLRIQILSLLPAVSLSYDLSQSINQESISAGLEFKGLEKDIVLKDITFSHDDGIPVLSRLNMTIPRGKMTALIGQSGSGKSTITDLLLGFYKPQSGRIMINDKELSEWSLASIRSRIGYVSQDTFLFNISIRDNIALGANQVDEDFIINAANAAFAHDFIINLAEGYDTIVADRGAKLSGGQRQRIAIARAIIRNPDILIFDEATSSLDNESEKLVQKSIEKLSKEKTILIIAHRLSTIENADVVYNLDEIVNGAKV